MPKISPKQQKIILIFLERGSMTSSELYAELSRIGGDIALITVKRALSLLVKQGLLDISGSGRTTSYNLAIAGRVFADIDAGKYCRVEPDKRYGMNSFNFQLLSQFPVEIFTDEELEVLHNATTLYEQRIKDIPVSIQKKEMERLIIELSWKSSKIEGNTYTLLDTEKLILEHEQAVGHDKDEAIMILNHKDAFNFIHENRGEFQTFTTVNLEKLHSILVGDLGVGLGFRQKLVGVVGSKYQPLDNIYQIKEAIESLGLLVSKLSSPYAKVLAVLLGISYIQPFEDGNKRTGRLMANAVLLAHGLAPLSYRSVDENEYREAILVFYELNSILPFKKIFIDQYNFATQNYAVV